MEGVREEPSACVTPWWSVWHTALYLDTPLSPEKFLRFHRFQGITAVGLVPERNNEFIFFSYVSNLNSISVLSSFT